MYTTTGINPLLYFQSILQILLLKFCFRLQVRMRAVITPVLLLLLTSVTLGSQLGCPIKCDCDYRAYNMTCNSTDLTRFPPYMV
jgi:hypothetical protein